MANLIKALQKEGLAVDTATRGAEVKGWLHSGNYGLNFAMAGRFSRGYPLGHATEMFGLWGTGKSYLIARALAEAQRAGGMALLDDVEHALCLDWAGRLGVDVDALAYVQSSTVLEHTVLLDRCLSIVRAAKDDPLVVIALDSLAALTTEHELKTLEKGTKDMARAQEIHKLFRSSCALLKHTRAAHLIANHKISPMSMFQKADSSGGGGAKYFSSVRLDLHNPRQVKAADKEVIGAICRITVPKTRFTAGYKETGMYIPYYSEISPFSGLLPLLLRYEVVSLSDAHDIVWQGADTGIRFEDKNFVRQDDAAAELVNAHPDILDEADRMFEQWEHEVHDSSTLSDGTTEEDA